MPSEADEKTDYARYRKYYLAREKSPEGVKKRVERDQARNREIKAGKLKPGSPLEVDHKKSLAKGGGNKSSNLQVITRKKNREKFDH